MQNMYKIGVNIRKVRELRGYSQEYVANKLNISQASYARMESEDTKITVDRLFQIAKILETNVSDFFDNSGINIHSQVYNGEAYCNGYIQNLVVENKDTVNKLIELYKAQLQDKDNQIEYLKSLLAQFTP